LTPPEEPQRASPRTDPEVAGTAPETGAADVAAGAGLPVARPRPVRLGLAWFAGAIVLCLLGYLAVAVPGTWFPGASPLTWGARDASVMRGAGAVDGDSIILQPTDASGTTLVSINTDFRSTDYRAIAWDLTDVPADADVRMLWRSDFAPSKMNSIPVAVAAGRVLPVETAGDANWLGRIKGIALAVHVDRGQAVRLRGVAAKPMGAGEILGDRMREWLTFEGWGGTSGDGIAGGAPMQNLPLPLLLATAAALAMAAASLLLWRRGQLAQVPTTVGAIFLAAWFLSDLRWEWNLGRQVAATQRQYAGKDWRDKHVAAEDGALFTFIEQVRAKLPPEPVRIFVAAEAAYFRDRSAWHLYPHNVLFDPYRDVLPPTSMLRAGDYVIVYQRRGVQYNQAEKRLRFPDGTTVAAEAVVVENGAALFLIS
jgi:hypothetical protein